MTMEKIISKQNNQIKLLKKLSQKKYLYQEKKFLVENLAIVYDALKSGYDFEAIFVTEGFRNKNKKKFEYLKKHSKSNEFYLIDEKVNKYYSSLETPSGITAVYNIRESFIKKQESVVYLNAINDPGNLGTIMRTMLAFDFLNLVVDENCADIYNPKTINASKDAIFKLNIEKDKENNWLKNSKLPIYVTNPHKGEDLDKFKSEGKFCLVLGSESHGVSNEIINMADKNIKINMKGDIESLNVSVAAGIFLYKLQ